MCSLHSSIVKHENKTRVNKCNFKPFYMNEFLTADYHKVFCNATVNKATFLRAQSFCFKLINLTRQKFCMSHKKS